jgi:endoglucanase
VSVRSRIAGLALVVPAILVVAAAAPSFARPTDGSGSQAVEPGTRFYVPKPNHGALDQIAELTSAGQNADADLIETMIETPSAVWFTRGSPKSVQQDVKATVSRAEAKGTVPVLVAYNIPFRDCSQFSAGGATSVAEYNAWINAFAAGIGDGEAIVILEPDGLGIIPWYDPYGPADGSTAVEWCQPAEASPATAASDRFAMLNAAVDQLNEQPNVSVYLDGTHSSWLGVGDAAQRLVRAGVQRAAGFYLNVSNYQHTANLLQYGRWISSCIAYATAVNPGDYVGCPNQYWNGGPLPAKIAQLLGEWTGVALRGSEVWSDDSNVPELNTSGINLRYANMLGATAPTTHFVIDTSRNGRGPWVPPVDHPAGDAQDWCNPPDRGTGIVPTANTGVPLLDAYLWVKIPGESDGQCNRWAAPGSPDPVRGVMDPPAGEWFADMALELARNATP